jgi:hypothetical protein
MATYPVRRNMSKGMMEKGDAAALFDAPSPGPSRLSLAIFLALRLSGCPFAYQL